MSKKLFVITLALAILFSMVSLSVFADYSGVYTLDSLPTNTVPRYGTEETSQTYAYWGQANGNDYYLNIYKDSTASTSDKQAYFFLTHWTNGADNQYRLCVAIEDKITDDNEAVIVSFGRNRNSGTDISIRKSSSYNAVSNLSYAYYDTYIYCLPYCMVVNGDSEGSALTNGLSALRTAIDNGTAGGVTVSRNVTIEVKPNNIAYIGYSGGTATFDVYYSGNEVLYSPSVSFSSYWTSTNLPTQLTTVNDRTGTKIIFYGVGDKTMLNQYQHGQASVDLSGVGYLVLYNPYAPQTSDNRSIYVTISDYVSCVQYPLTTNLGFNGLESVFTPDHYYVAGSAESNTSPEYLEYNVDGQGNVTTSPAISVPSGGNNIIIDDESDGLEGFVEKILNLFTAPIRYIQNLVDSGSSFMAWISQLWYWLPPEVGVIIGSALAVIVVIGAIKLLWK